MRIYATDLSYMSGKYPSSPSQTAYLFKIPRLRLLPVQIKWDSLLVSHSLAISQDFDGRQTIAVATDFLDSVELFLLQHVIVYKSLNMPK